MRLCVHVHDEPGGPDVMVIRRPEHTVLFFREGADPKVSLPQVLASWEPLERDMGRAIFGVPPVSALPVLDWTEVFGHAFHLSYLRKIAAVDALAPCDKRCVGGVLAKDQALLGVA